MVKAGFVRPFVRPRSGEQARACHATAGLQPVQLQIRPGDGLLDACSSITGRTSLCVRFSGWSQDRFSILQSPHPTRVPPPMPGIPYTSPTRDWGIWAVNLDIGLGDNLAAAECGSASCTVQSGRLTWRWTGRGRAVRWVDGLALNRSWIGEDPISGGGLYGPLRGQLPIRTLLGSCPLSTARHGHS